MVEKGEGLKVEKTLFSASNLLIRPGSHRIPQGAI